MTNPYQSPQSADEPPVRPPVELVPELPPYNFRSLLWTHFAMTVISFATEYADRFSQYVSGFVGLVAVGSAFVMPLVVLSRCTTSGPGHRAIALVATTVMAYASFLALLPAVQ